MAVRTEPNSPTLTVYAAMRATPTAFVAFWGRLYPDPDVDAALYEPNIRQPLTPERVRSLFLWKNGGKGISAEKQRTVEESFVAKIGEVAGLPPDLPALEFLSRFRTRSGSAAVWRIFWLHLWQPDRYPIYDQHVHRAMSVIETGRREEPPEDDQRKIAVYLDRYLRFHDRFRGLDSRMVDRSLWTFGRFMKEWDFPLTTAGE